MHRGWTQIAVRRDLQPGLNVLRLADCLRLLVKSEESVAIYDGVCPHRGASLGHGGQLGAGSVVCPFHGLRIGLGCKKAGDYAYACAVPTIEWDGMIFAGPLQHHMDGGWGQFVDEAAAAWTVLESFTLTVAAAPQWVAENAFDALHFKPVHGILDAVPFTVANATAGYAVESRFILPPSLWHFGDRPVEVPFRAHAFSPTLVVSDLGGDRPYRVITSAVAQDGYSRIFISIALPRASRATSKDIAYLTQQMRAGLAQDRIIWENISQGAPAAFAPGDEAVAGFRRFCQSFQDTVH